MGVFSPSPRIMGGEMVFRGCRPRESLSEDSIESFFSPSSSSSSMMICSGMEEAEDVPRSPTPWYTVLVGSRL